MDAEVQLLNDNRTEPMPEDIDVVLDVISYLNNLPMDEEVDPRVAKSSMDVRY